MGSYSGQGRLGEIFTNLASVFTGLANSNLRTKNSRAAGGKGQTGETSVN